MHINKFLHSVFFFFALVISNFFLFTPYAHAAEFSSASIRLDRISSQAPLSGLVCATPSNPAGGVENTLSISFPSDFTLHTTLSNWTTSTSTIPSGSSAWPGIGSQPLSVSGTTVTFASNDLSSSTQYCFTFQASSSTTGATGHKSGTLTTKNSSNTTIESSGFGITIQNNDHVTVSGTVPARPTDYQAELRILTGGDKFKEDQTLEFDLLYGSYLDIPSDITVRITWSLGTLFNSTTPTIDVLEYVINSATKAYQNTPAVIDTANRTITWTISDFPANTQNKVVSFRLRTTGTYTGPLPATFRVSATTSGISTESLTSTISKEYEYHYQPPQAPTTPTPTPLVTPTPLPTAPINFSEIDLPSLNSTTAEISFITSLPSKPTLYYGTAIQSMTTPLTTLLEGTNHSFTLPNLKPNSVYYFLIQITQNGKTTQTDIFTFKTPATDKEFTVIPKNIIVTSKNLLLTYPSQAEFPTIVIPKNTPYELTIPIEKGEEISRIQAYFANQVLGINNFTQFDPPSNFVELTALAKNLFSAQLTSPKKPGTYHLYTKIISHTGTITQEKLLTVRVINRLTIFDQQTKKPVENARAFLSLLSPTTKQYIDINPHILPLINPRYSEPNGEISWSLPQGTYRMQINAIGYQQKIIDFTIGTFVGQEYPEIFLEKSAFSFFDSFSYYLTTISDVIHETRRFTQTIASSYRFFDLATLIVLSTSVYITLIAFSTKFHLSPLLIPWYVWHLFTSLIKKPFEKIHIYGTLLEKDTNAPITFANVYFINKKSGTIVSHAISNSKGIFCTTHPLPASFKISIIKHGFLPFHSPFYSKETFQRGIPLYLEKKPAHHNKFLHFFAIGTHTIFSFLFETLLIVSILNAIIIGIAVSFSTIAPFLVISLLNLLAWVEIIKAQKATHLHEE